MIHQATINSSKRAYVEALIRLLQTETLKEITIKQLALESGYSRRTYYRYFKTKTAILDEGLHQALVRYQHELTTCQLTPNNLPTIFIDTLWPHRNVIQLLAQHELLLPLIARNQVQITTAILQIKAPWRSKLSSENPSYRYAITYSIGGFGMLLNTLFTEKTVPAPKLICDELTLALNELVTQWQLETP